MKRKISAILAVAAMVIAGVAVPMSGVLARDVPGDSCRQLPNHGDLASALADAQAVYNAGFGLHMWGTVVNRDGEVCAVAFTGGDRGDQWPGSRVISAQKANTANAFSLPVLALSTANLHEPTQPGGSLYGLQHSNPVDVAVAYGGEANTYGQPKDAMVGGKIGGVNVFGGGLALYNSDGELLGAVGVSGDSSCADHNVAWRTRNNLGLDKVPGGVSGDPLRPDNIIFGGGGFGHPLCGVNADEAATAAALPPTS